MALGWTPGDVDNHEEYFNYQEEGKTVLHCDHCTNTYKTELRLTKHISRMHSQDDDANMAPFENTVAGGTLAYVYI